MLSTINAPSTLTQEVAILKEWLSQSKDLNEGQYRGMSEDKNVLTYKMS